MSLVQASLFFESVEQIYERVFRELKPRTPAPEFRIRFYPYANMDSTIRLEEGHQRILVKISDQMEGAPAPVHEALAQILLRKLLGKPASPKHNHRYRLYVNRLDIRRRSLLLRQIRGKKPNGSPQGKVYDLEEMFADLNKRFFDGLLARPDLSWSPRGSRWLYGHYDPAHNVIVISKIFDRPQVPRFLVEYILYHEMLHLRHPVEYRGTRRHVHTRNFRENEKKFPRYKEAVALLKQLS